MNRTSIVRLATAGLLVALIVLLGVTGLGMFNVGVVYVTILCVPVIIGTQLMGLRMGLVLALCFGTYSLVTALQAPSALVTPLLARGVGWVVALCYLPRLVIPVVTHAVFRAVQKRKSRLAAIAPSAVLGSLTNTALYLGLMLAEYLLVGLDAAGLLATIAGISLTAGVPEAIVAALIAVPVVHALDKSGYAKRLSA